MAGKGLIKFFAIALSLVCLVELFPTFYANRTESKAEKIAQGDPIKKKQELEKLSKNSFLGMNYEDASKKSVKLGLDLKGGLNLMLEISEKDLIASLTNNSKNPILQSALNKATEITNNTGKSYNEAFFEAFEIAKKEANQPDLKLSSPEIFGTKELAEKITYKTSDSDVKNLIQDLINSNINTAIDVIGARVKKLGIEEPNIQRVTGTGRILVELPGITDADRVKKLLQSSAKLEFWEVEMSQAPVTSLTSVNAEIATLLKAPKDGASIGSASLSDTAKINEAIAKNISTSFQFSWASKPEADTSNELSLYALKKSNIGNGAAMNGDISDASVQFDEMGQPAISMQMSSTGSLQWAQVTKRNLNRPIAIVLDNSVYSAPFVRNEITGGSSSISGKYSLQEATDLVDVLKSGKLPTKANIVQADVVGPSLGQQSINNGLISFGIAYLFIIAWMIFYYGRAGFYANIALAVNLFFLIGIMAAFGAVLTLPGIAGIVLTMGMAVDANIIVFERVKEEIRDHKKSLKDSFLTGQKHALNAIIDGNLTTLIIGLVLLVGGTGPIKGFAITLVIGIFCTLFTAIGIAGLLVYNRIESGKDLSLSTSITKNWFNNINFDWIGKRKIAYAISVVLIIVSLVSIFTKGFDKGVDYTGGRTYVVKLDKSFDTDNLIKTLTPAFIENGNVSAPSIKKFGNDTQIRLTTKYGIESNNQNADTEIKEKLYNNLKPYLPANLSQDQFSKGEGFGIQSSSEVGPSVASKTVKTGFISVTIALSLIFIYILVRFRNWQMSLGAVLGLAHDTIIVLGVFSLLSWIKIFPFSVELDQTFIAALLTIIGYSINDTVIVFDRIRENKNLHAKDNLESIYNHSINSTLGRTINTGISTIMVTIIIFFFGGVSLQGFMFALFLGFAFGMYSSIYIASALSYDLTKRYKK